MAEKKKINKKLFETLCSYQLTKFEICAGLEISDKTLDRWIKETYGKDKSFSEVFKEKKVNGVISLRRYQMKAAQQGNATMLIFLDKKLTGYKDDRIKLQEKRLNQQAEFERERLEIEREKLELLKARFSIGEGGEDEETDDNFMTAMLGEIENIFKEDIQSDIDAEVDNDDRKD